MDTVFLSRRKSAAVVLVLVIVVEQLSTSPVVPVGLSQDQSWVRSAAQSSVLSGQRAQILRRRARMTPLWRVLNSKPFGAYCQNNYECSTGLCRGGFCATMQRMDTASVTN